MKRFQSEFLGLAGAAMLMTLGFCASPSHAEDCLPIQAGGAGDDMYVVNYADYEAVIYTYSCHGRAHYIIGKYEWHPITPAPTDKRQLAAELQRLREKNQSAEPGSLGDLQMRALEQLRLFQPSATERQRRLNSHRNWA